MRTWLRVTFTWISTEGDLWHGQNFFNHADSCDTGARKLLEIKLPMWTEDLEIKQMTLQKVIVCICVMAWRDSPMLEYFNTLPEARHSQRKEQKKWKEQQEKNKWSPSGTTHTKVWPTKAPQNSNKKTSFKANQDLRIWTDSLTQNPWPQGWSVLTNQQTCSEVFHMTRVLEWVRVNLWCF